MDTVQGVLGIIISMSTVLGVFTGIINRLFSHKLKPIENKMDANREESIRQHMKVARHEVVSFAGELHRGVKHTLEETEAIFEFIDTYNNAIDELGISNSLFVAEEEFIKEYYQSLINNK